MFALAGLREAVGKSQADVVRAAGMYQADVSKLERSESLDKVQVSTLRKYAAALGGQVQLVVVIGKHRYVLTG